MSTWPQKWLLLTDGQPSKQEKQQSTQSKELWYSHWRSVLQALELASKIDQLFCGLTWIKFLFYFPPTHPTCGCFWLFVNGLVGAGPYGFYNMSGIDLEWRSLSALFPRHCGIHTSFGCRLVVKSYTCLTKWLLWQVWAAGQYLQFGIRGTSPLFAECFIPHSSPNLHT